MKRITTFVAAATLFLAGCATNKPVEDLTVPELVNSVRVEQSEFSDSITLYSIDIRRQTSQNSVLFVPQMDQENYFLRTHVNRDTKEVTFHQVYVSVSYRGDWRYYRSANLPGGDSLEFVGINRNVISCADSQLTGCRLSEDFAITLTDQQFNDALESGLRFRVNTRFSDRFNDYTIPATVFQAQAASVERL